MAAPHRCWPGSRAWHTAQIGSPLKMSSPDAAPADPNSIDEKVGTLTDRLAEVRHRLVEPRCRTAVLTRSRCRGGANAVAAHAFRYPSERRNMLARSCFAPLPCPAPCWRVLIAGWEGGNTPSGGRPNGAAIRNWCKPIPSAAPPAPA
jgi:hypothetical protein